MHEQGVRSGSPPRTRLPAPPSCLPAVLRMWTARKTCKKNVRKRIAAQADVVVRYHLRPKRLQSKVMIRLTLRCANDDASVVKRSNHRATRHWRRCGAPHRHQAAGDGTGLVPRAYSIRAQQAVDAPHRIGDFASHELFGPNRHFPETGTNDLFSLKISKPFKLRTTPGRTDGTAIASTIRTVAHRRMLRPAWTNEGPHRNG